MKKRSSAREKSGNEGFFSLICDVTRMVPYGRITSYGAIARYLGTGRSARMVGWALNSSHTNPDFIPAHRVVNRNGMLTGKHHFGNSSTMRQLLENEGFRVEDNCVLDFKDKFWDPSLEL
ncbi:MAG TPA: MGMT family protein [Bacteroidales bacterium]|nr:MGMT family protein [Bacteroidales bacterium]